jgi:mannosyl-3-phosphoglycerate phosphatase
MTIGRLFTRSSFIEKTQIDQMEQSLMNGGSDRSFTVIFSDLDGTLLDHDTYGWRDAAPALDLLKRRRFPLILVSSKTRAEMDVIRHRLGLSFPFISENGGGVFFPKEGVSRVPPGTILAGNSWRWSLGPSYALLVKCLGQIRDETGWNIRGFSEMTLEEISQLTGLDLEASRLAAMREYDEPFIVTEPEPMDIGVLNEAANRRGLSVSSGGRFYHLHGKSEKGDAVEKLISWYREPCPQLLTIALGDSPNDFGMLKRVNVPVLVRSSRHFPGIEKMISNLRITHDMGPKGWNSAILEICNSLAL